MAGMGLVDGDAATRMLSQRSKSVSRRSKRAARDISLYCRFNRDACIHLLLMSHSVFLIPVSFRPFLQSTLAQAL